jgi:hypothetical protein
MDATFEEDSRDHGIRPHVSELRRGEARDDAGQRLSAFLRMLKLWSVALP